MVAADRVAAASGPVISLVVATLCIGLGLSVAWRGDVSETAAGLWPPAGVALAALLVVPARRWAWVLVGVMAPTVVGFAAGAVPADVGVWWMLGNCVEPVVSALVIRRFVRSRWFSRGRLLAVFLAVAVVIAPLVAGAIGAVGTVMGFGGPWHEAAAAWAVGDGLGVLVVVPLLITDTEGRSVRRPATERVGLWLLVVLASGLAFVDVGPDGGPLLPYLMLAVLIWAGMRFGTRAVAAAGFVVGLSANAAVSHGLGPFAGSGRPGDAITLHIFLAVAVVTSFVVATIASDLAGRDEVHRLLTHQATHDALTGLPNRVLFAERLDRALCERGPGSRTLAVLLLDLDDFKKINDRHGHPTGDLALGAVAERLRSNVRPGDVLARLGGDEFGVVSTDLADAAEAHAVAAALLAGLDHGIEVGAVQHLLTGSIGIATVVADEPVTASDLIRRSDVALYEAKETLGRRIALFDGELEARTHRRVELAEELHGAIDRGEVAVAYQPIVALATGRLVGFEALARWTNPRLGSVAPEEMIAVAEATGLIDELGEWVLARACRQAVAWRREGREHLHMAVNVSARQLNDVEMVDRLRRTLVAADLPAADLTLEITETAMMDDTEVSQRLIASLRSLGVQISMDDFGTGHSSMTNLRRIPLDSLKIDRSFVAGLGQVAGDTAIVEATITLGHTFGLTVVAEGIETPAQLEHLIRLGCDLGQGYLWSQPVPAAEAGLLIDGGLPLVQRLRPALSP